MKGFLALALAAAPDLAKATLSRPVHLAFSYDEEVGCLGAPDMIEVIAREEPGRPGHRRRTLNMVAVRAHKGIATFTVTVTGREAHSSLTHLGVSANTAAIKLMAMLVELSEKRWSARLIRPRRSRPRARP